MKLVINRNKWLRGERLGSYLVREEDGKMCCLGFLGVQCGIDKNSMLNVKTPGRMMSIPLMSCPSFNWPTEMLNGIRDSGYCKMLMKINDEETIKEADREEFLKRYFKEIDVEVEFMEE